jgi:hypothetical protein
MTIQLRGLDEQAPACFLHDQDSASSDHGQ